MTALRIGDNCLACFPGEVFVEYGLAVKRESPFARTLVVELANGSLPGYCYTEEAYAQGGYEVDTSMLAPEFGSQLTEHLISLTRQV